MDYLNFVVEHGKKDNIEEELNIFETVLIASRRARDLSESKTVTLTELEKHKHTTAALYETTHHMIDPIITESKQIQRMDDEDYDDSDDN